MTAPRRAVADGHASQDDRALAHLRRADPVLARLIDAHPGLDPRAWLKDLPAIDAFGALVFHVTGQQLSVSGTRRILGRLQDQFGGQMPAPAALLVADQDDLRKAGLSRRKVTTLRAVAAQFADGSLSGDDLQHLPDDDILERLTTIPGIDPWTAHGFLIITLRRADVVLPGDLALRKAIQRAYQLDHLPTPSKKCSRSPNPGGHTAAWQPPTCSRLHSPTRRPESRHRPPMRASASAGRRHSAAGRREGHARVAGTDPPGICLPDRALALRCRP